MAGTEREWTAEDDEGVWGVTAELLRDPGDTRTRLVAGAGDDFIYGADTDHGAYDANHDGEVSPGERLITAPIADDIDGGAGNDWLGGANVLLCEDGAGRFFRDDEDLMAGDGEDNDGIWSNGSPNKSALRPIGKSQPLRRGETKAMNDRIERRAA